MINALQELRHVSLALLEPTRVAQVCDVSYTVTADSELLVEPHSNHSILVLEPCNHDVDLSPDRRDTNGLVLVV